MRWFTRFKSRRGFTLVELMIVVAIIGVLAALAIYGVRRYLASAKTSEAKNNIGALVRGGIGAFERETTVSELPVEGAVTAAFNHDVCGSGVFGAFMNPVPADVPVGTKYQPNTLNENDFETGTGLTGWKCLRFTMTSPIYYQYNYLSTTCSPDTLEPSGDAVAASPNTGNVSPEPNTFADCGFQAFAIGDLNGDLAVQSFFSQVATVNITTRQIRAASQIHIDNEYD